MAFWIGNHCSSVTKRGSICMDVLIPKTTDTDRLWIQDLLMKLHCMIWIKICFHTTMPVY
jgi:hypothetical protein